MDTNDFLGSFAQENVSFSTQVVRTASVGDNFWTPMIFVEKDRFVDATVAGWEDAPGLSSCRVLVVTADTYAQFTTGLLASWLYDLFCNGFTGNCILVAPNAKVTTPAAGDAFKTAMDAAYDVLKPYGYHKTVCAGGDSAVYPAYAVALATKCAEDTYLSGAPLLPVVGTNPNLSTDPLYSALKTANKDAFMSWHSDSTHNAALYSLGLALAVINGSSTSVGNGMDMTASSNITASNGGVNPTLAQKNTLKPAFVQYFKTVGDNTGNVAAETDKTILGKVYSAYWILAYITYMTKVRVAQMITQRNFFKNAMNYAAIVSTMEEIIARFVDGGMLTELNISAPAYADLPEAADDEIVIPNAWSATYVNHLRKVTITGTLYIGS